MAPGRILRSETDAGGPVTGTASSPPGSAGPEAAYLGLAGKVKGVLQSRLVETDGEVSTVVSGKL